jgi:hypothetical protein
MKLLVGVALKEIASTAVGSELGLKEEICHRFLDFR